MLGLLNSRRRPQLLTARQDFFLLIVALTPLVLLPMLNWLDMSWSGSAVMVAVLAGALAFAAPQRRWVVYNILPDAAQQAACRAMRSMHACFEAAPGAGIVVDGHVTVHLAAFVPLRNVSIRLSGADAAFAARFEQALARALHSSPAPLSPMAVGLLLVATTMLLAPLALMAHRVPEIVRILTDLLH